MRKKDVETLEYYLDLIKNCNSEQEHNNSMMGLYEYMVDWRADYQKRRENPPINLIINKDN